MERCQNARKRYKNVSHALVNAGDTPIAMQTFRDRCKFERFAFFVKLIERWTSAGVKRHGVTAP